MVLYVPNLVQLIGLGLAVDYSLLIVHRFKEELADDETTVELAIVNTMATAGRTVLLSGVVVAVGLSVLLIIPVPFVRSLGFAGLVVPLVSIVAAFSLSRRCSRCWGAAGVGFCDRPAQRSPCPQAPPVVAPRRKGDGRPAAPRPPRPQCSPAQRCPSPGSN